MLIVHVISAKLSNEIALFLSSPEIISPRELWISVYW
jgi:hypothetical protein